VDCQAPGSHLPAVHSNHIFCLQRRRCPAGYIDHMLNGERRRATSAFADEYEIVINLKTAKTLGMDVPDTACSC
jgi:hypothetical protein